MSSLVVNFSEAGQRKVNVYFLLMSGAHAVKSGYKNVMYCRLGQQGFV